jgi:hypothetical protein
MVMRAASPAATRAFVLLGAPSRGPPHPWEAGCSRGLREPSFGAAAPDHQLRALRVQRNRQGPDQLRPHHVMTQTGGDFLLVLLERLQHAGTGPGDLVQRYDPFSRRARHLAGFVQLDDEGEDFHPVPKHPDLCRVAEALFSVPRSRCCRSTPSRATLARSTLPTG